METYTTEEYAKKSGLKVGQVKTACFSKNFDCTKEIGIIPNRGQRERYFVFDTQKTRDYVAHLKSRKNRNPEEKEKYIILKNGLEVKNDILGRTMQGENDVYVPRNRR